MIYTLYSIKMGVNGCLRGRCFPGPDEGSDPVIGGGSLEGCLLVQGKVGTNGDGRIETDLPGGLPVGAGVQ